MPQRSGPFDAAIVAIPLFDMLRYHLQSANAKQWSTDYGLADRSEEEFDFLYAYSPLHNIEEGVCYPPTLITTAKGDALCFPHGPHPGLMEKSIGQKETLELAVMVDTFRPLMLTQTALDLSDGTYYKSWVE